MNKEKKNAVEFIQEVIDFLGDDDFAIYTTDKDKLLTILSLIENQQKELEQEKEKNKSLKKQIKEMQEYYKNADFIFKDIIKEKIEDYEKMVEETFKDETWCGQNRRDNCYEIIRVLKELLEEK